MLRQGEIELLSPAQNLECGYAAIDHGADAVYIGANRFSARSAAGNSLEDIEKIVQYSHLYNARTYVALNTLLTDSELEEAVVLIQKLYNLGIDGLIIQDVGLLECDLPPINLHASTQMDNRSLSKVQFLEKVGFQQVVLARELSLQEIQKIADSTTITLECFVHGALCVSYSGQCYISEVMTGRSGNRGECAQFCRHKFSLEDGFGKKLSSGKYLLSLKDLDLSSHLSSLINAGVRSFKIEGRLKDQNYVKNVTAFYREKIDALLEGTDFSKSSSGKSYHLFQPDPEKSFQRGNTDYFLNDIRNRCGNINSPKSIGELVGRVSKVTGNYFEAEMYQPLHNGDGLCYFNREKALTGFRVNRVDGKKIYPHKKLRIKHATRLYRNVDTHFQKLLERSEKCRKIAVDITIKEQMDGLAMRIVDETGLVTSFVHKCPKETAKDPASSQKIIVRQVKKSGDTPFYVQSVRVETDPDNFYSSSIINEMRRHAFVLHVQKRMEFYQRVDSVFQPNDTPWIASELTSLDNISNDRALAFYERHGAKRNTTEGGKPLMTCKYCIRSELRICLKDVKNFEGDGSLLLKDRAGSYFLRFDCKKCEMHVLLKEKNG